MNTHRQVNAREGKFFHSGWNWMQQGFNMLIVMANKMLSEFQFHLVPKRKRRRESWGETERERTQRKEWVKSWVGISLQSYSPLMCDEWLSGRCEIGSIKMLHFSSGVWRLSKHHLRYQHISPALLDATHEENTNKQTVMKSQAYWTLIDLWTGRWWGVFTEWLSAVRSCGVWSGL